MKGSAVLELNRVSVTYNCLSENPKIILNEIDLSLLKGNCLCVIGGNGIGKSTLIKVISGELKPSFGRVMIDGKDCTELNLCQRSEFMSVLSQNPLDNTATNMTVLEHLIFAVQKNKKRTFRNIFCQKKEYIEFFQQKLSEFNVGLEDKIHLPVGHLSGGQRQLLSIIMSVLNPPKVLVLDEHTASLSPKVSDFVMEFTNRVMKEYNISVIMVTHNMKHLAFSDAVITIENGHIKHASNNSCSIGPTS